MGQNQSEESNGNPETPQQNALAHQIHHNQSNTHDIPNQYNPQIIQQEQQRQQNSLLKSRSTNYNQSQFNSMTQSIPNLRSFADQRSVNESDPHTREFDNQKKPPFQKQNAKHLRKDANYKKNLYSAMTSRVLRQQQESQLGHSAILNSQRSLTSLSLNQSHQHQLQRCQSPLDQRIGYYNNPLDISAGYDKKPFDSSFVNNNNFHNPIAMKKQYSDGITGQSNKKVSNPRADFSISTQLPYQEQQMIYNNNNENNVMMIGQQPDNKILINPYGPIGFSQRYGYQGGVIDSHSFTLGQNDQYDNSQDNMKLIQQQLYKNYEKAKNLTKPMKHKQVEVPRQSSKEKSNKKYDSYLDGIKNQIQFTNYQQQQLQSPSTIDAHIRDSYSTGKPQLQPSQVPHVNYHLYSAKERDSSPITNPPYKIRVKNDSQASYFLNSSQRFSQFSYIKREIKFGGSNCQLDTNIALSLILFDMPNFRKYLCLSPQWHHLVLEAMDEYFKKVEVDFVMKNYEYLLFKKSYTNSSVIHFCGQKGIRVDRVIVCEVLNHASILNKCLRISYSYRYTNAKSEKDVFVADYKLDVVKSNQNRVVWIHKDEQEQINQQRQYQISEDLVEILRRPYVQPITQICSKDTIEIAINLYSLQGLVDIDSIEWLDCSITVPPKYNVITYDKDKSMRASKDKAQKIYCDMSRICELEDAVVEWYDARYFQRQEELLNISYLTQLFAIKKYECAGIDGLICKIQLQANKEGRLYNQFLGIPIVVRDTSKGGKGFDDENNLTNEVKRLGLLIDRYVDLELRLGDTLVIYISRGSC